jgi:predicted MarR family transcription regulator
VWLPDDDVLADLMSHTAIITCHVAATANGIIASVGYALGPGGEGEGHWRVRCLDTPLPPCVYHVTATSNSIVASSRAAATPVGGALC